MVAVGVVLLIVAAYSPPGPSKAIDFGVRPVASTNGLHQECDVVVSNSLDSLVVCLFADGFKEPVVRIAYLSNGIWHSPRDYRSGGGLGVLRPHQSIKCTVEVPPGATAVRMGLAVTPLSWKGRVGWDILANRKLRALEPVGRFLLSRDTGVATRTRTEWSDAYPVRTDGDSQGNGNQ